MTQTSTVLDFKRGRGLYGEVPGDLPLKEQMGTGETGRCGRQSCVYWGVGASRAEMNEALHFIIEMELSKV